ncbi:Protein-glutamine gamma-glutamyltransferase [Polystyrenella longa]|uniref:Protein-glutamine gamma-glutamyltransferase n=2 Tax=Polystyrenella longa TaxID=2528007 RepID=A0A518CQ09_9PLAN|nr:Protein-glutamine gamma-glutamyltransferase [Polystyrenella longa]
MLCVAQNSIFPQGILLVLVPLAYYLSERRRILILPTWAANTLGVIAFLFASLEFQGIVVPFGGLGQQYFEDFQIRAGTNLIVYLSCIVLFMEKRTSYYWGILIFGVLLVALGCIFTKSTEYSLLLLVFMISGLWTLFNFMIYEAQLQHYELSFSGLHGLTHPSTTVKPELPASRFQQPSTIKGTIKFEEGSSWFTRSLLFGFLMMCILTFFVAIFFYIFIPRTWIGDFAKNLNTPQNQRLKTGFNDNVKLGRMGSLLSSSELVMEFDLEDENGKEVDLYEYIGQLGYDVPYFRGNVLTLYENETWKVARPDMLRADFRAWNLTKYVKQNIRMVSAPTGHLFAIYPASQFDTMLEINRVPNFNFESNLWSLDQGFSDEFNLEVTLFPVKEIREFLHTDFERPFIWQLKPNINELKEITRRESLAVPPGLEELQKVARDISIKSLERQGIASPAETLLSNTHPEVRLKVVDDLTEYLKSEKNFTYSTELSITDPAVDPVVDFLINTKRGHCEYFASALTLMCRSVGIPARLVTGFKGASKNNFNNMYSVQQKDAHAWVEVHVPSATMQRWYVFDPTPGERELNRDSSDRSGTTFADIKDAISSFWRTYVVNFTAQQQFNTVIKPIAEKVTELWQLLKERGIWELIKEVASTLLDPSYWFSRFGLMVFGVITIVVILARRYLRPILERIRRLWSKETENGFRRRQTVYFNERFKQICKKRGLVKSNNQTDQEFAKHVQEFWNAYLAPHGLQNFPSQLTNWYYQIRFGNRQPTTAELEPLNSMLELFEQEVKKIPQQSLRGTS